MSEEKKDAEIRVNIYENDPRTPMSSLSNFYPHINQNTPISEIWSGIYFNNPELINRPVFGDYSLLYSNRSRNINSMMSNLFGSMMNEEVTDNHILEVALAESLNHYKTQEKKPSIKLDLNGAGGWKESYVGKCCAICKSEFDEKEDIVEIPCSHIFHEECISEWVKYKPECPICRGGIPIRDENASLEFNDVNSDGDYFD
jgi:hypothetical protein